MKNTLVQNKVIVKKSSVHGYGVFAGKNIQPGEVIEECYTLLISSDTVELDDYLFRAEKKEQSAMVLGCGTIYNHADDPNADHIFDSEHKLMVFRARRFIGKGEEIFTSYGSNWFSKRGYNKKQISLLRRYWQIFSGLPLRATAVMSILFFLMHLLNKLTY